ncbi:MAG: FKBP-type peptidyl-prolyl cis-trans isomerase [Candidatus Latescibacteria bacterium]|nr:FKBP-type peptidyl-prolyl cis-trans isomerase [Candidatus Latescibacterota bacterium]
MKATILLAGVALFAFVGCGAKEPKVETEDQKIMYAVGLGLAESGISNLKGQLTAEELDLIAKGFKDGMLDKEPLVNLQEYGTKLAEALNARMAKAAEGKKAEGKAFLAKAAAEPGAVTTPTGLVYQELTAGTGPQPGPTSRVKFHYTISFIGGELIDSSAQSGVPVEKSLQEVFPGWAEGLQMMKVGGKAKLVIPPELAFGDRGIQQRIPPGATLVCEIELLGIL